VQSLGAAWFGCRKMVVLSCVLENTQLRKFEIMIHKNIYDYSGIFFAIEPDYDWLNDRLIKQ
jgi:hypothetical protein